MKQYIWFHPSYVAETESTTVEGQKENEKKHNYIVLGEKDLGQVRSWDHLTIVGHSTPPKKLTTDKPTTDKPDADDSGFYIQGDTADECVTRLKDSGLKVPPKILSLECCHAAISGGIAEALSAHQFFKTSLIEANPSGIGRNPGNIIWSGFLEDKFGRVVMNRGEHEWVFMLGGERIAKYEHGSYALEKVLEYCLPIDFHTCFFSVYKPGFFGGRVGRYCEKGTKITFEKAMQFAESDPDSATGIALQKVMTALAG